VLLWWSILSTIMALSFILHVKLYLYICMALLTLIYAYVWESSEAPDFTLVIVGCVLLNL